MPFDFIAADGVNREDTIWISARWQEARMKMDLLSEKERILIPRPPTEGIGRISGGSVRIHKNGYWQCKEWGRLVESAVGALLANRSLLDGFELLYWRKDKKEECDYILKKGQSLVAIEVKSSSADNTEGYDKIKELFAEHITSVFIVGSESLPLEDFFSIDLKTLFRKKTVIRSDKSELSGARLLVLLDYIFKVVQMIYLK